MTPTLIPSPELSRLRSEVPALRVIDVRTGGEFESSHIPGAYNIPLDTLGEHATDLAAVDHPVVLVCQSGSRAASAHDTLGRAGKTGLYILDGGMNAWRAAGGEINEGTVSRWAMDRQVRLVAGSLVLAGVVASVVAPKSKWLAGGVGFGLVFSALSNTCAMGNLLAKLPYNRTAGCNINVTLTELSRPEAG